MTLPARSPRIFDLAIAVIGLLLGARSLAAQDHRIVDRPTDLFETGVPVPQIGAAIWVDDRQLLINALPTATPDVPWAGGRTLTRVVLVNFATRTVRVIAENAAILRFDLETMDAFIGPRDRQADAREVHVGTAGDLVEVRRFAADEPLPSTLASRPRDQLVKSLLRKADGYLLGDKTKVDEHLRSGMPVPTTWVRPGKLDLPLPIDFEELGAGIVYVDFLGKYLLNTLDAQASSRTNSKLNRVWKHPYTLTPYRLLSLDGTIEEIPYPQFVFDYGVDRFDELRIARPGILISQITAGGGAIYLFQSNQLYRLTSKDLVKGVSLPLSMSGVGGLSVAPGGCNVAYLHYDIDRVAVAAPRPTPRRLALVNVCKELS